VPLEKLFPTVTLKATLRHAGGGFKGLPERLIKKIDDRTVVGFFLLTGGRRKVGAG
jgi:hypothetical protein